VANYATDKRKELFMKIVILALMMICNQEEKCEIKVNQCLDDIGVYREAKISKDLQSQIFQQCFENYILKD